MLDVLQQVGAGCKPLTPLTQVSKLPVNDLLLRVGAVHGAEDVQVGCRLGLERAKSLRESDRRSDLDGATRGSLNEVDHPESLPFFFRCAIIFRASLMESG